MEKCSKIYVAGHEGMVGSAVIRRLLACGYKNIVTRTFAELDLRDSRQVASFFEQERPEYIFLAAARVGGIGANNTYKTEFFYDNTMIATNVIHAAHMFEVKKLINLGSSCIYPKQSDQPIKEEYLLTGALEQTNEPYALAKIGALKFCHYHHLQYGHDFFSVMPTNLYGQNDTFDLLNGHVLPAIMRKFHLAKLLQQKRFDDIVHDIEVRPLNKNSKGGASSSPSLKGCWCKSFPPAPLCQGCMSDQKLMEQVLAPYGITDQYVTLWGSGSAMREFLHVDDLAMALVFLMERYSAVDIGECINIGSGVDVSIKELATTVRAVVGYTGQIKWDLSKPDGIARKLLNISRIKDLGWDPAISIQDGLKSVYEWYCLKG